MKEIRQIIDYYDKNKEKGLNMALASVVQIEESSYRRIGARMLICQNGQWTGGISGGCLEGDALRRSQKAIFKGESSIVTYDTMEDDQNQIGVGLGCNGKIEVLLNPLKNDDLENEVEKLREIVDNNQAAILLKIIKCSISEWVGMTKTINENSTKSDFGGISDTEILNAAAQVRLSRRPQILQFKNREGLEIEVLVEYLRPETRLIIVGDNYDVLSMIGVAYELGWELNIVGRKRKMSKALYEKCSNFYEYEELKEVQIDEYTAVVLMTHDFNWDKKLLPYIINAAPAYIGMLGPKKRAEKMNEELKENDLSNISFFHSPVGLDIGAESPEEIAISIAAEIIAVMRDRKGQMLKFKEGTIHRRKTEVHVVR